MEFAHSYLAINRINKKRVLILDGAMGTQIQRFKLTEEHSEFPPKGRNNESLNLSQPKVIEKIHSDYAEAGADVLCTNTFGANPICQTDYDLGSQCELINERACLIARRASLRFAFKLERRIFIAGVLGPTNKSATISIDTSQPAKRAVTFDELERGYKLQINTMIKNKVDMFLIETVFDTLNAKAAIAAYLTICTCIKRAIVISVTISDASARTLSGQTLEAFWTSVKHANPLAIGLNCSLGTEQISKYTKALANVTNKALWVYPNAGIPNAEGKYSETASDFASKMNCLGDVVGAIGGCCGSGPEHISKLKSLGLKLIFKETKIEPLLTLSGTESLQIFRNKFYKVGERANLSGSAKFKQLIISQNYAAALDVVREQIVAGASIIDLNMDDALINSIEQMKLIINLIGAEPDLGKVPLMIDSSNWETLFASLKLVQGKCLINSISLKDGDEEFVLKANAIRVLGGVPIVIAFDELGQAETIERRIKICKRAHNLLVNIVGFRKEEIVFDLNTFAIATGLAEHDDNAVCLMKSINIIKHVFPLANIIAGASNLSFAFRGNERLRNSLHRIFLKSAIKRGLNMAIVNPHALNTKLLLNDKQIEICNALVFNIKTIELEEILFAFKDDSKDVPRPREKLWRNWSLDAKIKHAIINGIEKHIDEDVVARGNEIGAFNVIESTLMAAMSIVGKLFEGGKLFLSQVIKSARVMKRAVKVLAPILERKPTTTGPTIVVATVKGDVHDIGKNIVATVLSCNNYKIIDLGIMVPSHRIVGVAKDVKASIIGLSGLISPSLEEMSQVVRRLESSGCKIPLLVGGATTSKLHTALKLNPQYPSGIVIHVSDASKAVEVASKLTSKQRERYIKAIRTEYETIVMIHNKFKQKENVIKFDENITRRELSNSRTLGKVDMIGLKLSVSSYNLGGVKVLSHHIGNIEDTKLEKIKRNLTRLICEERWIGIRRQIGIMKSVLTLNGIIVTNSRGRKLGVISFIRQQIGSCLSLTDFISTHDCIGVYCCNIGPECLLIQRFLRESNKLHCALAVKTICDTIIENCSQSSAKQMKLNLMKVIYNDHWYDSKRMGINPAPGYPIWPDHSGKVRLSKLINANTATSLVITDKMSLVPQTSVIALVIANPMARYFGVSQITNEQVDVLAKIQKISKNLLRNLLGTIINVT
ncbi:MAG: homocysteine S-methyltransferase family protein [Candidatus Hodgkinia cicadicola]